MEKMIENPFSRELYVMAKPAGASCNLACEYCYYLEKGLTLGKENPRMNMSDEILEEFIRQYISAQTKGEVMFTWHGGEALLRPLSFYRKVLELQKKHAGGKAVVNCIQTNGTLITDEWCRFFKENNWLVGVSIDGPEDFHDEYRVTPGGKPSFRNVMRGIHLMQKHGVDWNAMAVVNDYNADFPKEFYNFFKNMGARFIQFTPIVERRKPDGTLCSANEEGELTHHSVTPEQWGDFLCGVFDEWIKEDVGKIFVQIFDSTLANYAGVMPGVCSLAETCGHAAMLEHNGDLYSCDHFAFVPYRLGNIREHTIMEMMSGERQLRFGEAKRDNLPESCRRCGFLRLCHGECPKNRFACDPLDGTHRLNYLCKGYRRFFEHSRPAMEFMLDQLCQQLPPSRVMTHFRHKPLSGGGDE